MSEGFVTDLTAETRDKKTGGRSSDKKREKRKKREKTRQFLPEHKADTKGS